MIGLWMYPQFWLFMAPALLLCLWAQIKVQAAFSRYSRVRSLSGFSGAEAARKLLETFGWYRVSQGDSETKEKLQAVRIQVGSGFLTDYYNPISRVLKLSPQVYHGSSLAALGVAAHEAGHAIQHAIGYLPLALRSALVPAANIGSTGGWWLFILGLIFGRSVLLMDIGIILFSLAVLFYLITLPVEFNASRRAVRMLQEGGIITSIETGAVKSVLNAAALTYVAAALMAILQLVWMIFARGGRED